MKKIILILMFVLLASLCYGVNMSVYSFKIYSDNEQLSYDWEDDRIYIEPGKTLEFQIRYENNYNSSVDIQTISTFYDLGGEDLQRDKTINVPAGQRGTVVLEYYVPTSMTDGTYNFQVRYKYEEPVTGNEMDVKKDFDMVIRAPPVDTESVLLNLTKVISNQIDRGNELAEDLKNITPTLNAHATCLAELADYKAKEVNSQNYKSLYENKTAECKVINDDLIKCNEQKNSMYSQSQLDSKVSSAEATAKSKQKDETNTFIMWVAIGGIVVYFYTKRQKKVGGSGEGQSLKGATFKSSGWG